MADAPLLTCQELVEPVTDYREGMPAPSPRVRFEARLAVCPPCVDSVAQIDATVRAAGGLTPEVESTSTTQSPVEPVSRLES
jgi:hypothetical protein